jgi:NADH:ubiquinone oxidoreductase subunit E
MKITVKICMGTACYVMGGAELATLSEYLSPKQLECVEIKGVPCVDACFDQKGKKPPYVIVGDVMMSEANINKVKEEIDRQIKENSL